ncbi:hypothetical protein J6590_098684 [Homalodisca vitripennis]|nr:hypothetical protein J6590_098684 [Homalodisca vitripennis]
MPLPMRQQCLLLWQPRQTLLAPIGQVANQAVLPLTPTSERPTTPIRKLYLFDYTYTCKSNNEESDVYLHYYEYQRIRSKRQCFKVS